MTYYVKGYGYHENGTCKNFSIVFDMPEVNAARFIETIEKTAGFSPFRRDKDIIIENMIKL